ncbi:MAG: tetratricopeptide repeat protein [Rhodocyclaceae bacterium]|nr:tetratricopeptide repeat protein [Rhodocyclaceae bacterium]
MTAHAYDVGAADFDEKVVAASRQVPVIVDFWAEWCQPCRILKPILEKLAAEYGGRFILAKVDSDANPQIAARYGVRGIPAVKAFVDGQMVNEFAGALPEAQVRQFIDSLLPSPSAPLYREALEAWDRGDLDAARRLLGAVIEADPMNHTAYLDLAELQLAADALPEARQLLDIVAHTDGADKARLESLQAALQLLANRGDADLDTLARQVAADPADLGARLQLANALALAQDYRPALENLLEIVRRDRHWNEDAGRKTLLTLFNLLAAQPEQADLVREFRAALARTLN